MLTILNAVELSASYLEKKSIDSSRINAELLLADILNCKRMDLYLKFDQPLTEEETRKYREYIKRRGLGEPLQYITGIVEFYGLEFIVNKNVLIPRPDTEILVEEIINRTDKSDSVRILDVGTGSGNISITLSKNLENSIIHSIDISKEAISVAKDNAKLNKTNGHLTFENIDIHKYSIDEHQKHDIIVSNPPYISLQEYSTLDIELLEHEPKDALTDNKDGFSYYELIASKAKNLLNPKGKIYFELGYSQSQKVCEILEFNNFSNIQLTKDYQNIERVVTGELS